MPQRPIYHLDRERAIVDELLALMPHGEELSLLEELRDLLALCE